MDWAIVGNVAMNRMSIQHLPDECRALLGLGDICVYSGGDGVVRLMLSNKWGMRWSNPIPQAHLAMFGVLERHVHQLLAEPIVHTYPEE